MIRMFDSEAFQSGSSISLIGVTHHSKTSTLPTLVGLFHPPTQLRSTRNSDLNKALSETESGISIVGMGLVFDSTSFSAGTGPLFSFGLSDKHPLPEVMHSLPMETTLIGGELKNVTSRMVERKRSKLFGGEVTQRVIGCSISQSTNHNSGTAMMDGNLGGNVRCVNTSFSDCRREGNTDPSFINANITSSIIGRQLFTTSCTATLVSYSLCTFKDMVVIDEGSEGAALKLDYAPASLSICECFFQRCQCLSPDDDGGAICMFGRIATAQYFHLNRSSFSQCKSIGTGSNFAGCVFLVYTPSVTIHDCFFEEGEARYDGALTLYTDTHSILSNCAFVLCSAQYYSGAVGIHFTATIEFNFVQFRECSSTGHSNGRDVFFLDISASDITSDMFKFCESTSGSPNLYFNYGDMSNDNFIPQLTSTLTISDIDIQFDEERMLATVTVTASTAIGGTMGILLDGLIVPRLVHVVFGTETEPSQTGTAVVSSGSNGILPKADYTILNHSVSSSLFPPPTILNCECSLIDANTSLVVVNGWCLEESDYVMKAKKGQDGEENEISLTWVNSRTLQGSALLYPLTAEGRLESDTEYEVTSVDRISECDDIKIELSRSIMFTTPKEPARIEACVIRLLSKDRTQLTLVLTGRLLTSTQVSLCLSNGSHEWLPLSPIPVENDTHCSLEFQVGKDEGTSTLAFGKEYSLQQDGESTNFVVNSGIVISVPNPPTLHAIAFSFANDLNTSCVVEVTGSDLVPSTEYNVTLNLTLLVIVRFSSSTKGMSEEIQIGWEGGLDFETEYIVTSIKPMCEEDGEILVVSSVSGETGKRPSSFNIFADSSSLEGSPFCGGLERACSSISEVWKIVCGLSIVRPTIEIVDLVKMENGIRIVGGMHVVIRNGTSSEPSLIIPSSFSLDSLSALIVVEATGFLELRNVDVSIRSSDPSFVFLSATRATIILREGSITGSKSSSTRNENESEDICSWTTGILQLIDCSTTISDNKMALLAQGVVAMKGGSLAIEATLFHDNTPPIKSFPSFRRNLVCSENGSIAVRSLTGGDGTLDHHHLWMACDGCTMTGEYAKSLSPLFVPTLSNTSTTSFDKKKELFEIEVKGSTLIPCDLFLEVFEVMKDKKEGTTTRQSLNRNATTSFTETSIKLTFPSSSLSSLKPELEWRGRLVFGEEQRTDSTFIVQPNRIERLSQSVKENIKWWLPLVIVVAVALLILILLIVMCVWRRKKNVQKEDKDPLMSAQEMEVEKYEEVEEDPNAPTAHVSSVRGLNGNTLNVGHWTENEQNETLKRSEEKEEREIAFENRVCGLSCGEKEGVVEVVDKTETLYRRLHVLKVGVDRRWAQLSVARGLSHAMKMWEYSAILTELTSHSVVLSGEKQMNLILKSDSTDPEPLTEQPTQQNEEINPNQHEDGETTDTPLNLSVHETEQKPPPSHPSQIVRLHPLRQSEVHRDDVRWQPPEEEEEREDGRTKTEGAVQKVIDRTKASVFRLGLVLWEIETGLVPFAEQDGVNSHRNLSIGILPPMEGIGEKMKDLMEECLSVSPDDRPSVDSIISRLLSMDGKVSAQKAQHIALS